MAQQIGFSSTMENNLSLALGTSPVTLYELTTAYSVIANLGKRITPLAIRHIKDRNDKIIFQSTPEVKEVMPAGVSRVMTSLMESVVQEGTATKVKVLGRPTAGKTGTTNNYNDAWFVGFTAELITGVWVGKDKDEALGINETGARAAIPMWLQYMETVLKGEPIRNFPTSPEATYVKIHNGTGKLADANDPDSRFEIFLNTHLPEATTRFAPSAVAANF
jgi:penicillin-binding protein 1A